MPAVEPHDIQPHGTAQQICRQAAQVEHAKYHADGSEHQVRPEASAFDLATPSNDTVCMPHAQLDCHSVEVLQHFVEGVELQALDTLI